MGQAMGSMAERKIIFLDTHVVVWLYEGKRIFTPKGRQELSNSDLRISPIVRFELMMLYEKKRIENPLDILKSLKKDFDLYEDFVDFSSLITESMKFSFTRDPFDRMIVGHASLRDQPLITKDSMILENFKGAFW